MTTVTVTEARAQLFRLLDRVAESHESVLITGKRANAILVSEEDWHAIQETSRLSDGFEPTSTRLGGDRSPGNSVAAPTDDRTGHSTVPGVAARV
ncbi:MAG: type II toxin-antitoxin system Phd/YefM family antitoxin [Anaerolineae bacterium]|nr:type II toxin-antitoxin system Phd/YefM family antitoxin [Anaerolineae bacterium]